MLICLYIFGRSNIEAKINTKMIHKNINYLIRLFIKL